MTRVACIRCDSLFVTSNGLARPYLCAYCFSQLPDKLKPVRIRKTRPAPKPKEPDHGPDRPS